MRHKLCGLTGSEITEGSRLSTVGTITLDHVKVEDNIKDAVLLFDIIRALSVVSLVSDVLCESFGVSAVACLDQGI